MSEGEKELRDLKKWADAGFLGTRTILSRGAENVDYFQGQNFAYKKMVQEIDKRVTRLQEAP